MDPTCSCCRGPKATFTCEKCQGVVCKKCVETLKKGRLSFLDKIPDDLAHELYCANCHMNVVAPALEAYDRDMARARAVMVFHRNQGEETRLYKRSERSLTVENCADREETLLRLAFAAAKLQFNTLLDVDIKSKKVRNFGYQTTTWSGTAVPTNLDPKELAWREKQRF